MRIWKSINSRLLYRVTLTTIAMQVAFIAIQLAVGSALFSREIASNPRGVESIELLMVVSWPC